MITINNIPLEKFNLEGQFFDFDEEEFLGRTETWCGVCDGKGKYEYEGNQVTCDDCDGTGEITDETNPDHSCGDWEVSEDPYDIEINELQECNISLERTCPYCHQFSRLHWTLLPEYMIVEINDNEYEIKKR